MGKTRVLTMMALAAGLLLQPAVALAATAGGWPFHHMSLKSATDNNGRQHFVGAMP